MRVVIADTAPINYLVLIGQVDLLGKVFARILIPPAVCEELRHADAPIEVRKWATVFPAWIELAAPPARLSEPALDRLDIGEREAIALAQQLRADLILMDDREGVIAARSIGLTVTGTLGILDLAAQKRLIDIAQIVNQLRRTNFRCRPELYDALLARHSG